MHASTFRQEEEVAFQSKVSTSKNLETEPSIIILHPIVELLLMSSSSLWSNVSRTSSWESNLKCIFVEICGILLLSHLLNREPSQWHDPLKTRARQLINVKFRLVTYTKSRSGNRCLLSEKSFQTVFKRLARHPCLPKLDKCYEVQDTESGCFHH